MAENKEELKRLLKVKVAGDKADLKLSIPKTKIMTSSPMANRWENNGLYFLGLQNHCRW